MENLIIALEQQLKLLEELHDLVRRETRELAEINVDGMAEINNQKESVTAAIEVHSAVVRKEIVEAVSREGLSSKTTLGELAAFYKDSGEKRVSRLHEKLNIIARLIKDAVGINREIAERFAASVASSLELLTRVINQSNTYGASGAYQQKPSGSVLINREA